MQPIRLLLVAALASLALPAAARADDIAATIAKARAYLGTDENLNRITAVRYHGTLEMPNPDKQAVPTAPKTIKKDLEVIFQSPYRMLQVMQDDKFKETQCLNDYSAWVRTDDKTDSKKWKLVSLNTELTLRMRAGAFENLAFYRGVKEANGHLQSLDDLGGSVTDGGVATLDGTACHKLVFAHGTKFTFTRWFDVATGRLLLTETDDGLRVREEGAITEGGVRFPQKLIQTEKAADRTQAETTIIFDKIELNKPEAASRFALPAPPK